MLVCQLNMGGEALGQRNFPILLFTTYFAVLGRRQKSEHGCLSYVVMNRRNQPEFVPGNILVLFS
jgi:hypothetical protein